MLRSAHSERRAGARHLPRRPIHIPTGIAFFALVFLYVGARIQPEVVHFHEGPLFAFGHAFFRPFAGYPGGLLDYAAAFLAQLNQFNWAGAALWTGLIVLVCLAFPTVVRQFGGVNLRVLSFVPAFLQLLVLQADQNAALCGTLGVLLAAGAALGAMALPLHPRWTVTLATWGLSLLVFGVAGCWPCVMFVSLIVVLEVSRGATWQGISGAALAVLVVPLWLLFADYPVPLKVLIPWSGVLVLAPMAALYLLCPLAAVYVIRFRRAPASMPHSGGSKEIRPARNDWLHTVAARRAFAAGLLLLGWAVVWVGMPKRADAAIDYYSSRADYAKVIAVASDPGLRSLDAASEIRLQRALYHTGRLCEDLFAFRNQSLWDLLPSLAAGLDSCRAQSETLFELGLISDAERMAHEALETEGDRPDVLRRLAYINVLKGRPQAALIFLNRARQLPFQRRWAATCIEQLERDPGLNSDLGLSAIRARMLTRDLPHEALPLEALLRQSIGSNSTNRMAYEYLLATALLERNVNSAVERLAAWNSFEHGELPRHCQEAVLLYQQQNGLPIGAGRPNLRPETVQRFRRFIEAMGLRRYQTAEGRASMKREFGDTFWFHCFSSPTTVKAAETSMSGS